MAVYTKLIKKDISSLINNYQINKIEKFQGIKKGIENTNYLLKTKQNKFILTKSIQLQELKLTRTKTCIVFMKSIITIHTRLVRAL